MKELNLQEIRQQLDVIDASLTELFETRMELCREVAEYKYRPESLFMTGSGSSRSLRRLRLWLTVILRAKVHMNCFRRS